MLLFSLPSLPPPPPPTTGVLGCCCLFFFLCGLWRKVSQSLDWLQRRLLLLCVAVCSCPTNMHQEKVMCFLFLFLTWAHWLHYSLKGLNHEHCFQVTTLSAFFSFFFSCFGRGGWGWGRDIVWLYPRRILFGCPRVSRFQPCGHPMTARSDSMMQSCTQYNVIRWSFALCHWPQQQKANDQAITLYRGHVSKASSVQVNWQALNTVAIGRRPSCALY